jgi:hypothetical protein
MQAALKAILSKERVELVGSSLAIVVSLRMSISEELR